MVIKFFFALLLPRPWPLSLLLAPSSCFSPCPHSPPLHSLFITVSKLLSSSPIPQDIKGGEDRAARLYSEDDFRQFRSGNIVELAVEYARVSNVLNPSSIALTTCFVKLSACQWVNFNEPPFLLCFSEIWKQGGWNFADLPWKGATALLVDDIKRISRDDTAVGI